ncbi:MAG: hypothetical protein NPIRA02_28140 [Nitrospirales bacterium]|nr:MAG: hypothetical protein NPIRA02_28140 [Nitrospirales bacterium]
MSLQPDNLALSLREDFRYHLEQFYAFLHLAPPYNSVEKAIRYLSTTLQQQSQEEREQLATHHHLRWPLFEQAFIESGLPKKHHGIIRGLIQAHKCDHLPKEYTVFTQPFRVNP